MTKIIRTIAAICLAFTATQSLAAPATCDKLVPYGYPKVSAQNVTPLCRIAYIVVHDNVKKVPLYSAEWLLIENLSSNIKRVNAFKADPDLPAGSKAELADYDRTYDRGHMTPFEDARKSSAAALQTFYLSNMVPQNLHLNRGLWRAIENKTRTWAKQSSNGLYVITGPVFADKKIKTIGNGVAVPTHTYKVIIDRKTGQGIAFMVPNTDPSPDATLEDYVVTIKQVQDATGIVFTPNNPNASFIGKVGSEFKLD